MNQDRGAESPDPADPQYFMLRQAQINMWSREAARGLRIEVKF